MVSFYFLSLKSPKSKKGLGRSPKHTKESHLCHVVIASSDGYFIERICQDSKLKKTSELMEVKYLQESDVMGWLSDLKTYSKITDYVLNN